MNIQCNLILSMILLAIIITIKIYNYKKNPIINKESIIYKKEKKIIIILTIISFIILIASLICNKLINNYSLLNNILSSLTMFVLTLPISIFNLFNTYFKDEKEYCYTKTIVTTDIPSKKILNKYKKSHINLVIVTNKDTNLNLPVLEPKEISIKNIHKNIIIKSKSYKNILKKYQEKTIALYSDDLNNTYKDIIKSRGVCDNYFRAIKYNLITYISLVFSIIFVNYVMQLPFTYTLSLALLSKLLTTYFSLTTYKKMKYDNDIETRKVRESNIYLYKEEKLLILFQTIPIIIAISLIYTYLMASGASQQFINTTFYLMIIFSNIMLTIVNISESITFINILKIFKDIYIIIYIITLAIISILIYYLDIFQTKQITYSNVLACLIISIIFTISFDIIKLARYTSMKGTKKHGNKNNKKHKRS